MNGELTNDGAVELVAYDGDGLIAVENAGLEGQGVKRYALAVLEKQESGHRPDTRILGNHLAFVHVDLVEGSLGEFGRQLVHGGRDRPAGACCVPVSYDAESQMNGTQTTPSREKVNHDQTVLGFAAHDFLELGIAIFSVMSASAFIF